MQSFTFPQTISARDIQRGYKKVFDRVKKTNQPIVVMANNNPQGAVVSMKTLEKYKKLEQEQEFWTIVEEIRAANADKDPDEVYKDVTETVEQVRQELYDKANNHA